MFKQFIFFTFILQSFCSFAQGGINLKLTFDDSDHDFSVFVLQAKDTLFRKKTAKSFQQIIRPINNGNAEIHVYCPAIDQHKIYFTTIVIHDSVEVVSIDLNYYIEKKGDVLTEEPESVKTETHLSLGFNSQKWVNDAPSYRNGFSIGEHVYTTKIGRHTSIMNGFGFEYAKFNIGDTNLFIDKPDSLKNAYIHQFTLDYILKFRMFSGKVSNQTYNPKLYFDLGLGYFFPIMKRQVINLNEDYKWVEKHIGVPNDLRALLCFGYYPFQLTCSYRFFKSVQQPLPNPTRVEFGLNITIGEY